MIEQIPVQELQTSEPFNRLFPIDEDKLNQIIQDMATNGYDHSKPIDVWENMVIDGHTRLKAIQHCGIVEVSVYRHEFMDEDEALEYAIHNQRARRNMTDADILRCVRVLDNRRKRGGDRRSEQAKNGSNTLTNVIDSSRSSQETADAVGTSSTKVEKARAIDKYAEKTGDTEIQEAVETGRASLHAAYKETRQRVKEAEHQQAEYYPLEHWQQMSAAEQFQLLNAPAGKKGFNRQKNDNIEWAQWSWNPITGCLHGCDYCYARDIANRFYTDLGFQPALWPERLNAPANTTVPRAAETSIGEKNVFVCSMADLFGKWVPVEWIEAVLDQVRGNPQWNFLFLTKFPIRMADFEFPDNAWVGTTVDRQYAVDRAEKAFRKITAAVKFLSCEPLLEPVRFTSLEMFDWIIIGGASASSQTPEWHPPREWVFDLENQARIANCMVYEKTNLWERIREYPVE